MTIHFRCPHCGAVTRVDDGFAGSQGPCRQCGQTVAIPAAGAAQGVWHEPPRATAGRLWRPALAGGVLLAGLAVCSGIGWMLWNLRWTYPHEVQCRNNLREIYTALQAYRSDHGSLPPQTLVDEQGSPRHSWRVLLLPYLGGDDVYERYRFDEPWNGPHNSQLTDEMPSFYGCPDSPEARQGLTSYVAVVRPGLSFDGHRSADEAAPDVAALIVIEMAPAETSWLAPDDIDAAQLSRQVNDTGGASLSSFHGRRAHALAADGSVLTFEAGERLSAQRLGP